MALHQRDYILRMIERIAALLARVLKRRTEGDLAGARAEIAEGITDVLGPAGAMVRMVDSPTAANLLSDPDRITLYARLLDADAELQQALGDAGGATRTRRRALEMMLELALRQPERSDDAMALTAELAARVDLATLPARYASVLPRG